MEEKLTRQQQKAIHLYFQLLADLLNESGLDMRKFLKDGIDIEWTKEMVKKYIWKPIMSAMFDKKSTKDLSKKQEIEKIYDTINRHISQKHGLYIPFPSYEELLKKIIKDEEVRKARTK